PHPHGDVTAPDIAYALPVAELHGREDVGHLAAEDRDFVREIKQRRGAQPDAAGEEIQPLGDLAQGPIADHRSELMEEIHAEAGTRLIFDETDAVANGVVDAFEALARQRQWPVVNVGSKAHPASRTAWRNCLVRSFLGLPKNSLG